ncbi:MAG TPA: hypothetical protein VFK52_13020 [Nocardioidaceae bacterium]|nr:hypothetical protein [Nocardioidaceae bacterium]
MDARVWIVLMTALAAALPLVFWSRTRKRLAVLYAVVLILVAATLTWVMLNTGDCEPPENFRYRDALPGDCFKTPF